MEAVWPVTALYIGPVAIWAYWRFGRTASSTRLDEHHLDEPPDKAWMGHHRHRGAGWTRFSARVATLN